MGRRWFVVLLAVLPLCFCLWQVDRGSYIIWDGGFDLAVDIASDEPPDLIVLKPFGRPDDEEAAFAVLHPSYLAHEYSKRIQLFVESPVVVQVPQSGRDSMSGRELSRFWMRHLVVAARFPDGRWRAVAADIPDPRESRAIMVRFTDRE